MPSITSSDNDGSECESKCEAAPLTQWNKWRLQILVTIANNPRVNKCIQINPCLAATRHTKWLREKNNQAPDCRSVTGSHWVGENRSKTYVPNFRIASTQIQAAIATLITWPVLTLSCPSGAFFKQGPEGDQMRVVDALRLSSSLVTAARSAKWWMHNPSVCVVSKLWCQQSVFNLQEVQPSH